MQKFNESDLPAHDLATLSGWASLSSSEQRTIQQSTLEVDRGLRQAGAARLAVGEHLFRVREILEPRQMFTVYLLNCFEFSKASAYRWIEIYLAAKTILPAPYVRVAMLRGTDKLNVKRIASNPPPKTTSVIKISEYLDAMEKPIPRVNTTSNEDLQKEAFNFICNRFQKVEGDDRDRVGWLHSLVGMLLAVAGIGSPQSIAPVAVPEGFRIVRGRPRLMA